MIYPTQLSAKTYEPSLRINHSDASREASNYNNFLQLLTTQLKTQDPLKPLDSNQVVSQLATFSILEQSIKTNVLLSKLFNVSTNDPSASMIGRTLVTEQSNNLDKFSAATF